MAYKFITGQGPSRIEYDDDNYIDFKTLNEINFWVGGERLLKLDESAGTP